MRRTMSVCGCVVFLSARNENRLWIKRGNFVPGGASGKIEHGRWTHRCSAGLNGWSGCIKKMRRLNLPERYKLRADCLVLEFSADWHPSKEERRVVGVG